MLILASQSPRRREILTNAGIAFEVRTARVPEVLEPGESPLRYVLRLAAAKAGAIEIGDDETVLGADTIVVRGAEVLEKPADAGDARRMLRALSGREHFVLTGVCLRHATGILSDSAETRVRFSTLTEREIDEYVLSGEPMDKAGGYAIQGLGSKFVERIEGCYFNVVGLPIALVYRLLNQLPDQMSVPG